MKITSFAGGREVGKMLTSTRGASNLDLIFVAGGNWSEIKGER